MKVCALVLVMAAGVLQAQTLERSVVSSGAGSLHERYGCSAGDDWSADRWHFG